MPYSIDWLRVGIASQQREPPLTSDLNRENVFAAIAHFNMVGASAIRIILVGKHCVLAIAGLRRN
jgi:hypothetical protein